MSCFKRNRQNDKGAVLLTTLLIMSLMSAVALTIMQEVRVAIIRSGNMKAHAQAEWNLKAAEDFAQGYITENFLPLSRIEKNLALRRPLQAALEIDGGFLSLTIMDGTQCLPLSNLVSQGGSEEEQNEGEDKSSAFSEALNNLFQDLGMTNYESESLTAAIRDWQDADTQISDSGAEDYTYLALDPAYRTPNLPVHSIEELRAIRGMNEDIFKTIYPFICAGDADRSGAVNINTLQPEHLPLLSSLLGADQENLAVQLLQSRPIDGYTDIEEELGDSGVDGLERVRADLFTYEPEYLWIEVDATFGNAQRTVLLEFKVDSDSLTRTYRHYGTEGRRPKLEDIQTEQEERP